MILDKEIYSKRFTVISLFLFLKKITRDVIFRVLGLNAKKVILTGRNVNLKGIPRLIKSNNQYLCNSCSLCVDYCPSSCFEIRTNDLGKPPSMFNLNISKCSFCGLCEEICPENAIMMSDKNDFAFYGDQKIVWTMDKWTKDLSQKDPEKKV